MDINLDTAMQSLDPTIQQLIVNAARIWLRDKQTAPPIAIAPASGGRPGDEQYSAPIDAMRLLNTEIGPAASLYEIAFDVAGTTEHVNVLIANDGSMEVRSAE